MNVEQNGQGQFRGDFSRDTHDPLNRFSRVLLQQGRVMLDADWNEQTSILLRYLQTLAADLIGPHGGNGFAISADPSGPGFIIGGGHYYVNGVLCENERPVDESGKEIPLTYFAQADYPLDPEKDLLPTKGNVLVYLDVWERHVTFNETQEKGNPSIREVALGGPDTASRAQIVWQVKVLPTTLKIEDLKPEALQNLLSQNGVSQPGTGRLQARARKPGKDSADSPCVTAPESRYRGVENQLYRVEIHATGNSRADKNSAGATFKWSRENGSVIFPILRFSGAHVSLAHLGRDQHLGLKIGDWVEAVDDDSALLGKSSALVKVVDIQPTTMTVTLSGLPAISTIEPLTKHPLLRRWESAGKGVQQVEVPKLNDGWLPLEDGIEIQFDPAGAYSAGDYWLIPARVATGDVEWPGPAEKPARLPAHGPQHHYAPLGMFSVDGQGGVKVDANGDARRIIKPLAQ